MKKIKVLIDNTQHTLPKECYEMLLWLSGQAFFRQISDYIFMSPNAADHNPLISIYESALSKKSLIESKEEQATSQSIIASFLNSIETSSKNETSKFLQIVVETFLNLIIKMPEGYPRRPGADEIGVSEESESEGLPLRSAGGLGEVTPKTETAKPLKKRGRPRKKLTEGSHIEDVRNELPPIETPVKQKNNSQDESTEYIFDLTEEKEEKVFFLAKQWVDWSKKRMPWYREKFNAEDFYQTMITIRNTTDLNTDGLFAVFEFIKQDKFWKDQVLSPKSLLTKSRNHLRKIDNVLIQFRKYISATQGGFEETEDTWKDPFS